MKHRALAATLLSVLAVAWVPSARAACNLIPGTEKTFNSALGATNRPFAAPGERVEVKLRSCDASPGFRSDGLDNVVTLVFKPASGTKRVLVLAADCDTIDLSPCSGAAGVASATCQEVAAAELQTRTDVDQGDRRLVLTFPDTDAILANSPAEENDDVTLTGAVAIGVTAAGSPPACGLATGECSTQSGLAACIDRLYANDGACGTSAPDFRFAQFTALPPPNDFQADCFRESMPGPCTGSATEVRAAVASNGHLLIPMGWGGVLVRDGNVPVPRLIRTRMASPLPISVPGQVFLHSFTPEGGLLPPILEPQLDPTVASPDVVTFFGSVDAPYTVIEVANHHGTCDGGDEAGSRCVSDLDCKGGTCATSCVDQPSTACTTDAQCPSGACGRLFDFSSLVPGGGPVVLPRSQSRFCQLPPHASCGGPGDCSGAGNACVSYAFEATTPVPLDGLVASSIVRTFAISEAIDGVDRNGDGDTNDTVMTLRDRETGLSAALGAPAGCGLGVGPEGRAAMRIGDAPFRFPAVAVEDDVVAFLESETGQLRCDQNGDADVSDGILRIFRLDAGETTIAPERAVDAALRIDGAPLAVSNGHVYARTSEPDMGRHGIERASSNFFGGTSPGAGGFNTGGSLGMSADGQLIVFESSGNDLLAPGLDTGKVDVFVHDRATGINTRVSEAFGGGTANNDSFGPTISRNGRYVAFESKATNLLAVPTGDFFNRGIYVRDLQTGDTELVSVAFGGGFPNDDCARPTLSDDGSVVAFRSYATNLMGPGGCSGTGIYVYDRVSDTTSCASVRSDGSQLTIDLSTEDHSVAISADGRMVGFAGLPTGPLSDFTFHAYVHDRATGETEIISTAFHGGPENSGSTDFGGFSADNRFAVFTSFSSNLLSPGKDTNGYPDVYVRDLVRGVTERVSVASDGSQATYFCHLPLGNQAISPDGRFVLFGCIDGALVPGEMGQQAFRHDRASGTTEQVTVDPDGVLGDDAIFASFASISADGQTVAYHSAASNLLGPGSDLNGLQDVYIRGLDQTDPLGIDPLLFPDGVLDDVVLEVIDGTTGAVSTQCPAGDVSVADGNAAYLRPESAIGTLACPGGSLNGDMDVFDQVVQLVQGAGATQNLGLAATAVAASTTRIAALVSEPAEGASILNADGDAFDTVLHVYSLGAPGWTNVGQAADAIAISGDRVAFITPEAAQGAGSLNGPPDSDSSDRVAQVYDAATSSLRNLGQAAEELVLGDASGTVCGPHHLLAIRSSEEAQGAGPLNGDGDTNDDVLVVYDFETGDVHDLGYAVTPCRLEACDPRKPYNVIGGEVRFLTFETDQNEDLDGNGVIGGLVLQSFDICTGLVRVVGLVDSDSSSDPLRTVDESQVYSMPAGRCAAEPPLACAAEADCSAGSFCNTLTGRCTLTTPATCLADVDCPAGALCVPQRVTVAAGERDIDEDGVPDEFDTCPTTPNPLQDDIDGDGAGDACDLANCGDGLRQSVEQCDGADAPGCPGLCKSTCLCPFCGDDEADAGEQCDGDDAAACGGRPCQASCACTPNACGDGIVGGTEECDGADADACDGRGCQAGCTCVPPPVCGNGIREGSEDCDGADAAACPGECGGSCLCPAPILYGAIGGSASGNGTSDLYRIDPATGAAVSVGPLGHALTGLAYDRADDVLYGVTNQNAPCSRCLVTVDRTTGAATVVGPLGGVIADIAFRADGTLFGWREGPDDLATIDLVTGAATVVGDSGLFTFGDAMAFDASGTLHIIPRGFNRPLYTVDPATGAATPGPGITLPPGACTGGAASAGAIHPMTDVFYVANNCDGQAQLLTIDRSTGDATLIGTSLTGLDGLEFVPPPASATPTPTPSPTPTAEPTPTRTETPGPPTPAPGACAPEPLPGCKAPAVPRRSTLTLTDRTPNGGDVLLWKWAGGAETLAVEFGEPSNTTGFALCLYGDTDVAPTLLSQLRAPAGGLCAGRPCWTGNGSPAGSDSWLYRDAERTPDGLHRLMLVPGRHGRAKIAARGRGESLSLPPMPIPAFPIKLQLQGAGGCWETTYGARTVLENTARSVRLLGPE